MGLFNKKVEADAEGYFPATAVTINGAKIILLRWQEQIYALSSKCPHAAADISGGELYRGKVECPDHGYVFDVKTGRTLWPEDEMLCLKRYPVKVVDEMVLVKF